MKTLLTATFSAGILMTSGCSSDPPPELASNGNYFMVGGASCEKYRPVSQTTIECADANGNSTGYRNAMTQADMQMYTYQRQQAQQQLQALNQSSMQMQQNAYQMLQSVQQNQPQYPILPIRTHTNTNCLDLGTMISCTTR